MKRPQVSELTKNRGLKALMALLSALLLMLSLQAVIGAELVSAGETLSLTLAVPFLTASLGIMAVIQGLRALLAGRSNRRRFIFHLAVMLIFGGCALLVLLTKLSVGALRATGALYFAYLLAKRILYLLEKRRLSNMLFTILYCLVTLVMLLLYWLAPGPELEEVLELLLPIFISVRAFLDILIQSFSEMKLGVLQKIIRKTFALEILFGLFMLIISFAYVFYTFEPGFTTYLDALWYCFAVVTTIGFGDYTVVSGIGRALSVILGIYGIIVVALVTSIIVNFYSEVKNDKDDEPEEGETP